MTSSQKSEASEPEGQAPPMSSLLPTDDYSVSHPGIASSDNPRFRGIYAGYGLLERIGEGGISEVYLAEKISPLTTGEGGRQEPVALKIPRADRGGQPLQVRLIVREVERLLTIEHPHILPILDYSKDPDRPYLAMPYQKRGSLATIIRKSGLPERDELRRWMRGVLLALIELHDERELHHRDLKPGNILISASGEALLADFGLVKSLAYDSLAFGGRPPQVGTLPYLAPEVAAKHGASVHSEIYGFGACLYEALTGWPPYCEPNSPASLEKIQSGDLMSIKSHNPDADPDLTAIAERCMQRVKEDRYASMVQLLGDFDARTESWDGCSREKNLIPEGRQPTRSRGRAVGLAAIVVLGLLLGALGIEWFDSGLILRKIVAVEPATLIGSRWRVIEWNADPDPEFVTVKTNGFVALSATGSLIPPNLISPLEWSRRLTMPGLSDYDQDGIDEVIFGIPNKEEITLTIRNRNNVELRRFQMRGAYEDIGNPMVADHNTQVLFAEAVDLNNDGILEMLVVLHTGWMLAPRALICFDDSSQTERWRFSTGPQLSSPTLADISGDGNLEILLPGAAVNNGARGPDGLSDADSYVFAIDHSGRELWKQKTGNAGTYPNVRPLDVDGDGAKELLLFVGASAGNVWQAGMFAEEESHNLDHVSELVLVDATGKTLSLVGMEHRLRSVIIGDLNGDGKDSAFISTLSGKIYSYGQSRTLEDRGELRRRYRGQAKDYELHAYLDHIADLNGDGRQELVARVVELVTHHRNSRTDHRSPPTQSVAHFPRLAILDDQLRTLAEHTLTDKWSHGYQMLTAIRESETPGKQRIFLLADKIYSFDFE